MKIFSPPPSSSPTEGAAVKKNGKGRKHIAAPPKQEVSDGEIREKLASHVETSNTAKAQLLQKNSQAFGAGFMKDDGKPVPALKKEETSLKLPEAEVENEGDAQSSLKKSYVLLSDVQLNDPNDNNTQEKLKSVLKNGAFNFNPKEKETLEKILAGN